MNIKNNERIDDLEYKGLKIIQNKDWFCFGVDSVLISDYASKIKKNAKIVDIGTGNGIISLLLCKKTELSKIYGIEVQKEVAELANRNVELNGLSDVFEVINCNIKDVLNYLEPHSIDAIVTNPPYKKENSGVKSLNRVQQIARHEIECNLEDIIEKSNKLLKDLGEFYMVNKAERLVDIVCLMRKYKIEPKEIRFVHSRCNEKPELVLVKGVKCAKSFLKILDPLVIYNDDGSYTDEIFKIYNKKRD